MVTIIISQPTVPKVIATQFIPLNKHDKERTTPNRCLHVDGSVGCLYLRGCIRRKELGMKSTFSLLF